MKHRAPINRGLCGSVLLFCLACALGDRAQAQAPGEFSDAEARQLEADADKLKKECIALMAELRKSIPETSHMKGMTTAILSNRYCICAAREFERNMPVKAFRDRDKGEIVAFTQRAAGVCAMGILKDSWEDLCPAMMIRVAEIARIDAADTLIADSCSCIGNFTLNLGADELIAGMEADMEQLRKDPKARLDGNPRSLVGQMQACLAMGGHSLPLTK